MKNKILTRLDELGKANEAFVLATVIKTEGSASAKPGAKAIFSEEGKLLMGWVGGGCAESETRGAALEALEDGKTRIIKIDLDDEVLGAGMPCGGMMDVYVEPFLKNEELLIIGHGKIAETVSQLGSILGYNVTINDPIASKETFPTADNFINTLDYDEMEICNKTNVIIATQHKGDHHSLQAALNSKAPYIALIASQKRTGITFDYLIEAGINPEELKRIRAPAGLDLGGSNPEEVALSIMSEIIANRYSGSGRPMMEVKGTRIPNKPSKPVSKRSQKKK